MFTRILFYVGTAALALIALAFLAPFFLPAQTIKTQVEQLIRSNTGWTINLRGDAAIALFPSVRLVANDISVSPPDHRPILSAETARFSVGLNALLGGSVKVEEIFLGEPVLDIELSADGQPVWLTTTPEVTGTGTGTQPAPSSPQTDESGGLIATLFNSLSVETLTIENADITLQQFDAPQTRISDLTIEVSLPDPQGALLFDASASVNNDPVSLNAKIAAFKQLLLEENGNLAVSASYKNASLTFDGTIDNRDQTAISGTLGVSTEDLSEIAGADVVQSGSLNLQGRIDHLGSLTRVLISDGTIYGSPVAVDLSVDTDRRIPAISGQVTLGDLDIDRIRAIPATGPQETSTDGGQVSGPLTTSAEPDLSGLQKIDADLTFMMASLSAEGQIVNDVSGTVRILDGVLDLSLDNVSAAEGTFSATLNTDSKQDPLITYGSFMAANVSIPAVMAIAGVPNEKPAIDGKFAADLVFGFQGLTETSITRSMNARGTARLLKGRVDGLNLADTFNDPSANQIRDMDITVSANGFSEPLSVNGRLNWRGETIRLEAQSNPAELIIGKPAPTNLSLSMSRLSARFSGNTSASLPASGRLSLQGPSLRSLAEWLGTDLPPGEGFGAFNIATDFNATPSQLALSDLSLALDEVKGNGKATVALSDKPTIQADVSFDLLNVDPYIGSSAGGETASTASAPAPSQVTPASTDWSTEPIDVSFVNAANLDLTARVGTLIVQGIKAGPLQLQTTMRDGMLSANLSEMGFYGGAGTASVTVDATQNTPALTAKLSSRGVQAFPFLRDAASFERIEGLLNLNVDVTTEGKSEAELMQALSGTTDFAFVDGAVRGINIAKAMRSLTAGPLNGWDASGTEKTGFSAFDAAFVINSGVAANDNLRLVGPLVRMTGSGTVNIAQQSLDYRVDPKVVASLEGQGGAQNLTGFGVPIIIEGPWFNPRIYPDIKGFLENPQAGLEALKALGGGFADLAEGRPGELIGALQSGTDSGLVGQVGNALQERTGVNIGDVLQDGRINRDAGATAVVGVLGGLLGQQSGESILSQPIAVPADGIPVPRVRPNQPARAADPVSTIVDQLTEPAEQNGNGRSPGEPADVGQELLQRGLGAIFGN